MTQPADTHITATPHPPPDHGPSHGDHGPASTPPPTSFTNQEWTSFHHDDRVAAAAIVMLIGGIFTIGVILYTIVNWAVGSAP